MNMDWLQVVMFAVLIESVIESVARLIGFDWRKDLRGGSKFAAAIAVAVVGCVAFNIDLFAVGGFVGRVAFVGNVLSGFVFGRGSNYVHDVIKKIGQL